MALAAQNMDVLGNMENIKILANVLKTNVSACTSIGSFYLPQIGRIFMDMLGLYKAVSGIVSETIAREGTTVSTFDDCGRLYSLLTGLIATKTPKIRQLRTVKKEILKLMETYIKKAEDLEAVYANFIPPLLDAILGDYGRNVPAARDAEVLNVMATITGRLGVCKFTDKLVPTYSQEFITVIIDTTDSAYSRCRVRTDLVHDQPRLCRIP